MRNIKLVAQRLPVRELHDALLAQPYWWDSDTMRTADPASPHRDMQDIIIRWAEPGTDGQFPHESVWYEPAHHLPVKGAIQAIADFAGASAVGGVFITKLPPFAMCKPHTDQGWHARNYEKLALQVAANEQQAFHFVGESLVTKPGDLFWFDNANTHWVTNYSDEDRITMIVSVKTDWRP